jgi:predicted ATP-grasp superfamily ATP-dependent carboligase
MLPMLQRYHAEASDLVYSLSGFRDISGALVCMRGSRKVFQRPRRLGVGLCFEAADVPEGLAERAMRLCETIGYYGVFEMEFILCAGRELLIDFNGRFYNQIAFEIARGMDLPAITYAAATNDRQEMERLVCAASQCKNPGEMVFYDRLGLSVAILIQQAFGTMSPDEANQWRRWRKAHSGRVVSAVDDAADPVPGFIDMARQLVKAARHPRAFVRQTGLP